MEWDYSMEMYYHPTNDISSSYFLFFSLFISRCYLVLNDIYDAHKTYDTHEFPRTEYFLFHDI